MIFPGDERPSNGVVRAAVEIAAPPDDVFRALSDPSELASWLGDERPSRPDPRAPASTRRSYVGAEPWSVPTIAPDGARGTVRCELLVVDPPRRLVITWRASWEGYRPDTVQFDLVPVDVDGVPGTRLSVTHHRTAMALHVTGLAGPKDRGEWPARLARLVAHLGAPTRDPWSAAVPRRPPSTWQSPLGRRGDPTGGRRR